MSRAAVMRVEDLAHFLAPMTWPDIYRIQPRRSHRWWQRAVMRADDTPPPHAGDGLLTWDKASKTWTLTDKGVALVLGHARRKGTAA